MLHRDRRRAESFGEDALRYDRARPGYPEALVDDVLSGVARKPTPDVLDVGCGTGIVARMFAARGCHVLGVELDERMASVARGHGIDVEVAPFESWDPGGSSFDLVVSGQAWHWVDPRVGARRAAGALRPSGRLALFWNVGEPDAEVAAALSAVYRELAPGLDDYSVLLGAPGAERFRSAVEGIEASALFCEPETRSYRWDRAYTREEWLDQLPTHSDHRCLPAGELANLLRAVGGVIDSFGGSFVMHYDAVLITAAR